MNLKDIKQILILNSIITIFFIIYIEYNVGNIFIRMNSNGIKVLNFNSLFNYLINPLFNRFLWNIQLLDVNYIFVILFFNLTYYMFKI